jgi:mono/diheme cytochrome c family protein
MILKRIILFISILLLSSCARPKVDQLNVPTDSELVKRGKHLAQGVAACGFCHGVTQDPQSPLAGGRVVKDLYGELKASNITPSRTGIGLLRDDQVIQSIRGDWSKDADKRSPEVHRGYEWISTPDLLALVAYLKSLKPIKHEVEIRKVGFTSRNTTGLFRKSPVVQGYVPEIDPNNKLLLGQYIFKNLGRCDQCHLTKDNQDIFDKNAPSFIGQMNSFSRWEKKNIERFLSTGVKPSGATVDPSKCSVKYYTKMSYDEISALVEYISSL